VPVADQDLILDGVGDPDGIQVMTIHKSKSKQFDGVMVLWRARYGKRTPYRTSCGAMTGHPSGVAEKFSWWR
jgi:ATP-dependent exoDNAse (exonuclease V) beta subunit